MLRLIHFLMLKVRMKKVSKFCGLILVITLFFISGTNAAVLAGVYGESPQVDFSAITVPTCTNEKPKAPVLLEPNHPLLPQPEIPGEVILVWHKVPGATSYTIAYGLTPGNYIYGAADIGTGESEAISIRALENRTYYFVVRANNGCMPGPFSQEWPARPLKGGTKSVGGDVLAAATGFGTTSQIAIGRLSDNEDSELAANTSFVEEETVAAVPVTKVLSQAADGEAGNQVSAEKMLVANTSSSSNGFFQTILGVIRRILFG